MIAIQFDALSAPTGCVEEPTAREKQRRDDTIATPSSGQIDLNVWNKFQPNPQEIPLSHLPSIIENEGYARLLVVFMRSAAIKKAWNWSWPRALATLAGTNSWTMPNNVERRNYLEAMELWDLPNNLEVLPEGFSLQSCNCGYWLVKNNSLGQAAQIVEDLPASAIDNTDAVILDERLFVNQTLSASYESRLSALEARLEQVNAVKAQLQASVVEQKELVVGNKEQIETDLAFRARLLNVEERATTVEQTAPAMETASPRDSQGGGEIEEGEIEE